MRALQPAVATEDHGPAQRSVGPDRGGVHLAQLAVIAVPRRVERGGAARNVVELPVPRHAARQGGGRARIHPGSRHHAACRRPGHRGVADRPGGARAGHLPAHHAGRHHQRRRGHAGGPGQPGRGRRRRGQVLLRREHRDGPHAGQGPAAPRRRRGGRGGALYRHQGLGPEVGGHVGTGLGDRLQPPDPLGEGQPGRPQPGVRGEEGHPHGLRNLAHGDAVQVVGDDQGSVLLGQRRQHPQHQGPRAVRIEAVLRLGDSSSASTIPPGTSRPLRCR